MVPDKGVQQFSFLALQASKQKLLTHIVVTHLIDVGVRFDYHIRPVVLNSMILWFLRNIGMFCAFVNDNNNVLLLVDEVTAVEHIVPIRKHSLKTEFTTLKNRFLNDKANLFLLVYMYIKLCESGTELLLPCAITMHFRR
jgi:MFS-type transporter involved in bile tolerance (Atg22 family)